MDRKQFFDDNGYLPVEGVFTDAEMDALWRLGRPPAAGGRPGGPTYSLSRE